MRRLAFIGSISFGIALASCWHGPGVGPPSAPMAARAPAPQASGYHQVYSFTSPPDGNSPTMDLVQPSTGALLYGTTYGGGSPSPLCKAGCGTVYTVDPSSGSENVIWSFKGRPDGAYPEAGITKVINGAIYGTTFFGGVKKKQCYTGRGCGTVFEINGSGEERIIWRFGGSPGDGSNPAGSIHEINGVFYGTTQYGGMHGFGTIFALVTTSGKSRERVLYSFEGGPHDGAYPIGNLIPSKHFLYGVTSQGGASNGGTIFMLDRTQKNPKVVILHSFTASEGDYPTGITSLHGVIYGTASAQGANNRGSIFSITLGGKNFKVLHYFKGFAKGDGALPYAAPQVYPPANALYGTTQGGGVNGSGTIYCVQLANGYPERVIYEFGSGPYDGARPDAPVRQWGGYFWGTTVDGGRYGLGTIYRITPPVPCATPAPARYRAR